MKLALITDVHGNHVALEAVLDHVRSTGVDGIVFMGDYVSDFPGGHRVLEMVRRCGDECKCWYLRGNREDYLLDHRRGLTPWWKSGSAGGSLLYAYQDLTDSDLDFVQAMPYAMKIAPDGAEPFTACHSSPRGSRDPIALWDDRIFECLKLIDTELMVCGHAHMVRTARSGRKTAYFVGSAGLPDGFGGCAQFAYMDDSSGSWRINTVSIPYDMKRALSEFETSGLSAMGRMWSLSVMRMAETGVNYSMGLIYRANELAREAGAPVPIPEDIWRRAAADIGLI